MAAAASGSKFRDPDYVQSLLEDDEFNIIMYFVHGELFASETSVPSNSILLQVGEGSSFGCTLDTSADPEILRWFLKDREKAFRMLLGTQPMQIGVLSFFQYKVEGEPMTFEKKIFLEHKDLEKSISSGQRWGVYLIDQLTNKLILQDELTEYAIKKTENSDGVTQTTMMEHTNKVLSDKPNIHIFVNCAVIPKTFPASKLSTLTIPTGGAIATRSVLRHIDPNKNSYTRNNLSHSRDFGTIAARKVAIEIRKKLRNVYGFSPDRIRGFRKTINDQATRLVRISLDENSTRLEEYLASTGAVAERKAIAAFVAELQPKISMIVFHTPLWEDSEDGAKGGGKAERRHRTRRRQRRRGL